jgi:lipid-A-disaccharide synthase-like uncharacterized protein
MNEVLGNYFAVAVTPWKLIGLVGAILFAGRWIVQAWATKRAGRPSIPRSFWIISLIGSAMVTAYFIWGKNDAVGVLTNLLPACVAIYNLVMDIKSARMRRFRRE